MPFGTVHLVNACAALVAHWWALVSVAQQDALAATLVDDGSLAFDGNDGVELAFSELVVDMALVDVRW